MATVRQQHGDHFFYHVTALPIAGFPPYTEVTIYDDKSIQYLRLGTF